MPIVECVTVSVKPDISLEEAGKKLATTLSAHVGKAKGLINFSWGYQVENERKNSMFFTWEAIEDHINYTKEPSYQVFIGELSEFLELGPIVHVPLSGPHGDIFANAPVVEFLVVKISPDNTKDAFSQGLAGLQEVADATFSKVKAYGVAHGWTVEDERTFVLIAGWESKKAHEEWKSALSEEQTAKAFGGLRKGVESVEMVHVDVANGSRKY